jgi:hypothetical protein
MMDKAPTPTTSEPRPQTEFKVTDVSGNIAFLELADGRHIQATIKDGVEGVKRHAHVAITSDGLDKEGAPKDAVVTKVHAK